MPRYFFDSSAIFKRYYRETGSDWVQAVCEPRTRPVLYLSEVAHLEVIRALRQKQREAKVHPSFIDAQINQFERQLALPPDRGYNVVPLSTPLLELAITLCNRFWDAHPHPLRSLDAMQLASALTAVSGTSEEVIFVTSDRRLAAVSEVIGFRVVDPAHP